MTSSTTKNASDDTGDGDANLVVDEVVGVPGGIGRRGPGGAGGGLRRAGCAGCCPAAATGVALIAVGGLGRRQCAPYGDLDLVLLHAGVPGVDELAASVWYPIWDAGLAPRPLGPHPRRGALGGPGRRQGRPRPARRPAASPATRRSPTRCIRTAADQWRRTAVRQLPALREITDQPAGRPTASWPSCSRATSRRPPAGCATWASCGRSPPPGSPTRCAPPSAPPTCACWTPATPCTSRSAAGSTGWSPRNATGWPRCSACAARSPLGRTDRRRRRLLRRVAGDARTVATPSTTPGGPPTGCAPAAAGARDGRPLRRPVARDVVEQDGELVLARTAIGARPDPSLSLRVAAAAATTRLPIARATCEWLAAYCPPLPAPVAGRPPGPR